MLQPCYLPWSISNLHLSSMLEYVYWVSMKEVSWYIGVFFPIPCSYYYMFVSQWICMRVSFDMLPANFLTYYISICLRVSQHFAGTVSVFWYFSSLWMCLAGNDEYEYVCFYIQLLFTFLSMIFMHTICFLGYISLFFFLHAILGDIHRS